MMRHILTGTADAHARAQEVLRIAREFDQFPQSIEFPIFEYDVDAGYTQWAPGYDSPNPAIEREESIVRPWFEALPRGVALDAACGTGRHAATIAALGHDVIGVDATVAMLDIARQKLPAGDFRVGQLEALPVEDASVDLVTCSLALTHVEELAPVIREFARVLRPGGRAIISDMHPFTAMTGGIEAFKPEHGEPGVYFVLNRVHLASEYVNAFVAAGLRIERCEEVTVTEEQVPTFPTYASIPEATRDAYLGTPFLLIWQVAK